MNNEQKVSAMENNKISMKLPNRWTNACQWEGEIEDRGSRSLNIGEAVKRALASGANLRGANLIGADLRGANLIGANLRDANLRDANLIGANLRGANLSDANLRGANLRDADLIGANLIGANLIGADLRGANLIGANLRGANLSDANLSDANLIGANLRGANLRGKKIQTLRVFAGLYRYQIWAYVLEDGTPCVRMGCLYKTVPEWDAVTIRKSNTGEFPDDGSPRCEQRARAFEFARSEALIMAAECAAAKAEATP